MLISVKKFGTTLVSRDAGREAFLAFQSVPGTIKDNESIEIDFAGVMTLAPGWADEFLTPLLEKYGAQIKFLNTKNVSVKATLEFLEEIKKENFVRL